MKRINWIIQSNLMFVMDVALSKENYYIIECNCFNDSGFYDHDIGEIVKSINNYMRERN